MSPIYQLIEIRLLIRPGFWIDPASETLFEWQFDACGPIVVRMLAGLISGNTIEMIGYTVIKL